MGLFNRGFRPDKSQPPVEEDVAGVNGNGIPERSPEPPAEPELEAEGRAEAEERAEAEIEEGAEAEADEAPDEPETSEPPQASEPPKADEPPAQVESVPAVLVQEDEDEGRISAADALAPSRSKDADGSGDGKGRKSRAKVYSFANQKGGVAKTTTTLNLAVAFSESGHRVLIIDLDPQGNLTMSQGVDPDKVEKSMYDVLVHRMPISEVIHHKEVDIAVSSIDLAGAEIAMSAMIGRERSLEKALEEVADDYDFICIDTPPSLGLLTVNALTASDKVIVPVQCEYLSMRGLVQLQNTLEMIRENLNPRVEIEGILPTMLDSRTVHAKEAVEILEENFGELVFKSRIRKAIKFAEAPVRGSSVLKYDPKGNAAEYYRDLAKEVLTHGAS
jgi:chromosome partitioning protein